MCTTSGNTWVNSGAQSDPGAHVAVDPYGDIGTTDGSQVWEDIAAAASSNDGGTAYGGPGLELMAQRRVPTQTRPRSPSIRTAILTTTRTVRGTRSADARKVTA